MEYSNTVTYAVKAADHWWVVWSFTGLQCVMEHGMLWQQEMYDHGFSTMEKSHQRAVSELKAAHVQEMERLRQEKEELLQSEALDTQAGLCQTFLHNPLYRPLCSCIAYILYVFFKATGCLILSIYPNFCFCIYFKTSCSCHWHLHNGDGTCVQHCLYRVLLGYNASIFAALRCK